MSQHWWTGSTSKPQYQHETNATYKYFYDIAGNLASNIENGTLVTYYYNAQNKLTKIEKGSTVYEFLYDSQNRRIGIKKSGSWLFDIHDGMIPVAQLSNNGSVWAVDRYFVRGLGIAEGTGDVIAEIDDNGDAHYYCANHWGDTIAVLDDSSNFENYFQYDAFGDLVYTENSSGFKPRYTFSTKEHISEINGMLYAYRLYLIDCGRWTQRDQIDYQDSVNLYQFCGNNPIIIIDELGQSGVITIKTTTGKNSVYGIYALGVHSWIEFKKDGSEDIEYFHTNPFGITYDEYNNDNTTISKSMHISTYSEMKMRLYIKFIDKLGQFGWSEICNCSTFASALWYVSTGELLFPFIPSTPNNLATSILISDFSDLFRYGISPNPIKQTKTILNTFENLFAIYNCMIQESTNVDSSGHRN